MHTQTARRPRGPVVTRRSRTMTSVGHWAPAIAASALAVVGITRRWRAAPVLALAGGALAYSALGSRVGVPDWLSARVPLRSRRTVRAERVMTILRSPEELYAAWRDFEQLPRFMRDLESVTRSANSGWRWVARGPAGSRIAWEAEVVEERQNELISWQSVAGAQVTTRGSVRFDAAPADRGTEMRVRMEFDPPAGALGAGVAWMFGDGLDRNVREGLRAFKQFMEAGEVPTNDGQPMGSCVGQRS